MFQEIRILFFLLSVNLVNHRPFSITIPILQNCVLQNFNINEYPIANRGLDEI